MDATAAGARSPASDGPRPKRRPRSPRTAATRSQGCATAPYSGSCPTGCCASAKRRRCRWPTWKRPPTAGPSPSGPARPTRWGTARCGSSALPRSRPCSATSKPPASPTVPCSGGSARAAGSPPTGLGADSIRAIVRKRAAAVDGITGRIGGHSLRVGSARELAADGASLVELQQAGGWRSPTTPAVYVRRESATRGPVARRRYGVGQ